MKTQSNRSSGKHFTWSRKETRMSAISWKVECKLQRAEKWEDHMMTVYNNCACLKLINYSWADNMICSIFWKPMMSLMFYQIPYKKNIISSQVIKYAHISAPANWKHCVVFLSQGFCVVFDCEIISLWSDQVMVMFVNSWSMPRMWPYQVWVQHLNVSCVSGWLEVQTTSWSTDITPRFTLCFAWTPQRAN